MKTLNDLLIHELKDLYSAACYMDKILNRMSSLATHPKLVQMLDTYYSQVQYQKKKLQAFFINHSIAVDQDDSPIMSAIIEHGLASMRYEGSKEIRDLVLLLNVNIMKHCNCCGFCLNLLPKSTQMSLERPSKPIN